MCVNACGVHVYKCVYFQVCAEARGQSYVSPLAFWLGILGARGLATQRASKSLLSLASPVLGAQPCATKLGFEALFLYVS